MKTTFFRRGRRNIKKGVTIAALLALFAIGGVAAVLANSSCDSAASPATSTHTLTASSDTSLVSDKTPATQSALDSSRDLDPTAKPWWKDALQEMEVSEVVTHASMPTSANELDVLPEEPTPEAMKAAASSLGLESYSTVGLSALKNESWYLMFPNKADARQIYLMSTEYTDGSFNDLAADGKAIPLPEFDEAERLALAFVESTHRHMSAEVKEVYIKGTLTIHKQGEQDKTAVTAIGVRLKDSAQHDLIVGPGAKFEVAIGEDGSILVYEDFTQQLKPGKTVTLRSLDQAIADMKADKGLMPSFSSEDFVGLTVESVELGYYAASPGVSPTSYPPLFVFDVSNDKGQHRQWIVPAVDGMTLNSR